MPKSAAPALPVWKSRETLIAIFTIALIGLHLVLRFALYTSLPVANVPLWMVLALGGAPLVGKLSRCGR